MPRFFDVETFSLFRTSNEQDTLANRCDDYMPLYGK